MNVVVFTKQIPDPNEPWALDPDGFRLVRTGGLVIDDADRYGVEVALRLRDASGGGEVVAVSMAPSGASSSLRTALAMGVDRAIVVSDEALAGSDALSSAKVLAATVATVVADAVVAATESTDGYTGTVPIQVAEVLGWPSISYVSAIELSADTLRATRQTDAGNEDVECELPVVLSVTAGIVEPRYPSMRGIMSAKTKPIEVLAVGDLGLDPTSVGAAGARQVVVSAEPAPLRARGVVVVDDDDAHERLLALLVDLKLL